MTGVARHRFYHQKIDERLERKNVSGALEAFSHAASPRSAVRFSLKE
jgi:hypothetical protein